MIEWSPRNNRRQHHHQEHQHGQHRSLTEQNSEGRRLHVGPELPELRQRQRALAPAFGCARGAPSRIAHLRPPPRARLRVAQNDLTFLRIRSKKHEIMVSPDKDYSLIVIQNPNEMD